MKLPKEEFRRLSFDFALRLEADGVSAAALEVLWNRLAFMHGEEEGDDEQTLAFSIRLPLSCWLQAEPTGNTMLPPAPTPAPVAAAAAELLAVVDEDDDDLPMLFVFFP